MGSLSKLKIPIGLDIADYKRGALDVSKLNRQMKADTDLAKASSTAFAGQTVRSGAAMAGLAATTSTAATVMLPFSAATLGAGGAMVILTKNAGSTRDVTQSVEKAVGKSISTLANFTNVSRVIPGTLQAFAKAAGVSREQVAKLTGATGKLTGDLQFLGASAAFSAGEIGLLRASINYLTPPMTKAQFVLHEFVKSSFLLSGVNSIVQGLDGVFRGLGGAVGGIGSALGAVGRVGQSSMQKLATALKAPADAATSSESAFTRMVVSISKAGTWMSRVGTSLRNLSPKLKNETLSMWAMITGLRWESIGNGIINLTNTTRDKWGSWTDLLSAGAKKVGGWFSWLGSQIAAGAKHIVSAFGLMIGSSATLAQLGVPIRKLWREFERINKAVFGTSSIFRSIGNAAKWLGSQLLPIAKAVGWAAANMLYAGSILLRFSGIVVKSAFYLASFGRILIANTARLAVFGAGVWKSSGFLGRIAITAGAAAVAALAFGTSITGLPALLGAVGGAIAGAAAKALAFAGGIASTVGQLVPFGSILATVGAKLSTMGGVLGSIAPLLQPLGAAIGGAANAFGMLGGTVAAKIGGSIVVVGKFAKIVGGALVSGLRAAGNAALWLGSAVAKVGAILSTSVLGAVAAGIGAIAYAAKIGMPQVEALAKSADRLGMTTEALGGLQHAGRMVGQTLDETKGALTNFVHNINDLGGDNKAARMLDQVGLKMGDLRKMTPDQSLMRVADAFQRTTDAGTRAKLAVALFGEENAEFANSLTGGAKGLEAAAAQAKALGITVSNVDASKVLLAQAAMSRMWEIVQGLAQSIAIELSPLVEIAADWFTEWAIRGGGATGIIKAGIGYVVDAVGVMLDAIELAPETWRNVQAAAMDYAAGAVGGLADVIKANDSLSSVIDAGSTVWRYWQSGVVSGFAMIVRAMSKVLDLLPSLPTWLGGGKEGRGAKIAEFAKDFADSIDAQAAALAEKASTGGAGSAEAIAGLKGISDKLRADSDKLRTAAADGNGKPRMSETLRGWWSGLQEDFAAKAEALDKTKIKGTNAEDGQLGMVKDPGLGGALERNSKEAYSAIANRGKDQKNKEAAKTAKATGDTAQHTREMRDLLKGNQGVMIAIA